MATVDRLATQFDYCIEEAVGLIVSLPDGDYKQDLLHVSQLVTVIGVFHGVAGVARATPGLMELPSTGKGIKVNR